MKGVKETWEYQALNYIHIWYLSNFPVSRNWYKTVSNLYENSFICNLNKSFNIQQICNQSENDDISQEPENLRLAPIIIFFILHFAFLIDIIDNIITYILYYVTRTSANSSAVYWSRDFRLYHVTMILHYHWLKFWWRNTDYTPFHISFSVPLTLILTEE